MDKRILQTYSIWAKENLENQIEVSLKTIGINSDKDIKKAKRIGDFTIIDGDASSYPADLYSERNEIINLVGRIGYRNVIEEFAYTWFNRFVALRFMEVHGFIPHGFRVLSNPGGGIEPEILKNLNLVKDELGLNMQYCADLKDKGKIEELFRYVLIQQCNALSKILPMLFSASMAYIELLLPKTLLKGKTVITRLNEIPEDAFLEDVEIIGWMYQFYISSKKDAVYASKKTITKDTLPAVTQLFTPDWIVRYMAENSVGRLWLESYPDSPLRAEMKYYVEDAKQTLEVQKKLDEIKYRNVNPEDIRIIEPCCGSGHILVYVFDLLFKMYEERGYQKRDIPTLILTKNLTGLDVDKRAVQLASFSLIMKARSVNNRFFDDNYYVMPHVYELQDSELLESIGYRKHLKELKLLNDNEFNAITNLVDSFKEGKTIGSLLKIKPIDFACLDGALEKINKQDVMTTFSYELFGIGMTRLNELVNLAKVLSSKYDVMITNPPYRPISSMETKVRDYAYEFYPDSKTDLFSMFMETGFVRANGFLSMINMHSWMFLDSFEALRDRVLKNNTIISLCHLGARGFDEISGDIVQTVAFIMRNNCMDSFMGNYARLVAPNGEQKKSMSFLKGENRFTIAQNEYAVIPGKPVAYWVPKRLISIFKTEKKLDSYAIARSGLSTGKNERYMRYWFEPSIENIGFKFSNNDEYLQSNCKFVPCNKGGSFRKWYGNNDVVIDWTNPNSMHRPRTTYMNLYYRPAITWSAITSGLFNARVYDKGFLFDHAAASLFLHDNNKQMYYLGFLNTVVNNYILSIINPTINTGADVMLKVPICIGNEEKVSMIASSCVDECRIDWDSYETSWGFVRHPIVPSVSEKKEQEDSQFSESRLKKYGLISWHYEKWKEECQNRFELLKSNEEELNSIFINIYGLQDKLTPKVEDQDITIRFADKERDIKSLISYLIGLVMGRYSLDIDGLAYAGGSWSASKYQTYQPDDDGIVPIYNKIGMEDGLTTKLIELIKLIYGEDTYRQNIDFIAEVLGRKNNESSEEALNRYLNDGFYRDHLKTYKNRPIYWMFSSGKKAGFKCLIYMHRYNEDTLAIINAKYYLPESTRKKNELDEINGQITKAEGRERTRLEKERQNLAAAYNEALEYGQVLDHMANQYIAIDLDDGVKINYAKFQGVEFVTDNGAKVKKDLLVPLK